MGSTLAMPKTTRENSYLNQVNNNLTQSGDAVHADLWIGGSARNPEDPTLWSWVDGSVIARR